MPNPPVTTTFPRGSLIRGDALAALPTLPAAHFQLIIADAPYFRVQPEQPWDWPDPGSGTHQN